MWQWLHEKLPERFRVVGSLWLISGSVHLIFLLIAVSFSWSGNRQALVVSATRSHNNARIVLLPLFKTVRDTQFDTTVPPATLAASAPLPKKVLPQKAKVQPKPLQKKPAAKKVEPPKAKTTIGASLKKQEPKHTPKLVQKSVQNSVKQASKKNLATKEAQAISSEVKDEIIYVGRDDLRALHIQQVVANALKKNWRPPAGISQETMCHISFDVGPDGKACNIQMAQGSTILIFDVAARTAVMHAHFAQQAKGKQFTVAFKP